MSKRNNNRTRSSTPQRDDTHPAMGGDLGAFGLEPPKIYRSEQREEQRFVNSGRRREPQKQTLQERRQEQNHRRKRSKLKRKIVFRAVLALAIVAVIAVLSLTVFFKINTITITGNEIYSNKEITAVLPIDKNTNLFLMDKKAACQKLYENLPYIYKADITRKFPSSVVVKITETPVICAIKNPDKSYTLTDDRFKVLETNAGKMKKGSILITGVTLKSAIVGQTAEFSDNKMKNNLLKLTDAVNKLELEHITELYSKDINNNFMVYDGRITYKLGNLDKLDKKIYSALAATEQLNAGNPQAEGTLTIGTDNQIYFTEN